MQKWTFVGFAIFLILYFVLTETLDWIGRLDVIRQRWPKIAPLIASRWGRILLLVVAIALLVRVATEQPTELSASPSASPVATRTNSRQETKEIVKRKSSGEEANSHGSVAHQSSDKHRPNVTQSGQNNIAQIGDNNFAVINPAPPEAKVSWTETALPLLPNTSTPRIYLRVLLDRPLDNAAFGAMCDRPCLSVSAGLVPGISSTDVGGGVDDPKIAAVIIKNPNPMPSGVGLNWEIRSQDENPIHVLSVSKITKQQ